MNWKCTQCGNDNAADEDFCLACGAPKPANATTSAPAQGSTASAAVAPPPAQTTNRVDAVRTLIFGDQSIPLYPGTFKIARADSPSNPDLKIDASDVSGTALELTVTADGKVTVKYDSDQEKPYCVIKQVQPRQDMEILPGEAIVAGVGNMITLV